ncbi:MAG: hypothetical protein HQL41_07380 [Alphaproteobacteria bacterium]|nr:hypothetical protein [Alphaproteobacteria bacterium]
MATQKLILKGKGVAALAKIANEAPRRLTQAERQALAKAERETAMRKGLEEALPHARVLHEKGYGFGVIAKVIKDALDVRVTADALKKALMAESVEPVVVPSMTFPPESGPRQG